MKRAGLMSSDGILLGRIGRRYRLAPWLSNVMVSQQETQRALLTPGEVMQMPATDALIMLASMPPVRARKLTYYTDANFVARAGGLAVAAPAETALPTPTPTSVMHAAESDSHSSRLERDPQLEPQRSSSEVDERPPQAREPQKAPEARSSVREQIARYYVQFGQERET